MIKQLMTQTPLALLSLLLLAGCHGAGDTDAAKTPAPGVNATETEPGSEMLTTFEFPDAAELLPGVWGGGQPTREHLSAAAEAGVRTVVNMRVMTEEGAWDEREFVESLGMRFIHIPVARSGGVNKENAGKLAEIIEDRQTHPLMVHCASGRRVGALIEMLQSD